MDKDNGLETSRSRWIDKNSGLVPSRSRWIDKNNGLEVSRSRWIDKNSGLVPSRSRWIDKNSGLVFFLGGGVSSRGMAKGRGRPPQTPFSNEFHYYLQLLGFELVRIRGIAGIVTEGTIYTLRGSRPQRILNSITINIVCQLFGCKNMLDSN